MKRLLCVAAVLALFAPNFANAGGDAESGKAKAVAGKPGETCADCHGADGNKPKEANQPILAGQYYDYLVKALSDYKSGKRKNPIMATQAEKLSKKDMEDLAAWFASQRSSLHDQR